MTDINDDQKQKEKAQQSQINFLTSIREAVLALVSMQPGQEYYLQISAKPKDGKREIYRFMLAKRESDFADYVNHLEKAMQSYPGITTPDFSETTLPEEKAE